VEITYLGVSSFRIKGQDVTIITDPCPGKAAPRPATIATVSHDHPRHNQLDRLTELRKTVRSPGEYEIGPAFILGIATYHDGEKGKLRGGNTVFSIELEGVKLCHLGDLGHHLTAAQAEELGAVDVLLLPVGGVSTIDAAQAAEVVRLIGPKIVIPMHYRIAGVSDDLDELEPFLRHIGLGQSEPLPRLNVSRSLLSQEATRVVVMESPKAA